MSLPREEREMRIQGTSYGVNCLENPTITIPEKPAAANSGGGSKPKSGNPRPTSYRECLKNHAANIGGHVTDGCGEFMPSGDEGTIEALKCAACNCHRNFHRKDHLGDSALAMVHPLQLPPPLPSPSLSQHHPAAAAAAAAHWGSVVQPLKMAFGPGSGGTDSSSEELNFIAYNSTASELGGKKRFRTKFTVEQKERMLEYAEKLGWRIPREDDTEMQRFCAEVGVKRQVFKVWMHNNKTSSSSKKISQQLI